VDYGFEQQVYRYKCKKCRQVFCMPNCGTCPSCQGKPEQENSLCFDCLEKACEMEDTLREVTGEWNLLKPGGFAAIGHDQVMHCCSKDKEYHIWQRGSNGYN